MHAYKAITSKFVPATNTKGTRIKALAEGGRGKPHSVTISAPDDVSGLAAHARAVEKLCAKLGWTGELIPGALYNGDYVWVFKSFAAARSAGQ